MHPISSYRGNRHANKQAHKQTGPITIHCAAASAQCNNEGVQIHRSGCWHKAETSSGHVGISDPDRHPNPEYGIIHRVAVSLPLPDVCARTKCLLLYCFADTKVVVIYQRQAHR